ncbi:MAG TPA: VCBS repeat-containing protein [Roseimicrobium sp.]|nr:VCBS repeat-containing protein [Roseimicrobium sp.]
MRQSVTLECLEARALFSVVPTFAPDANFYVGQAPSAVATGDFNRDSNLDFITADSDSGTVTIRRGRGDGTFRPPTTIAVGIDPAALVVADFNKDGKLDFAVALRGENAIVSYKGNGAGGFTLAGRVGTRNLVGTGDFNAVRLVTGDFDGDSKLDLAVTNVGDGTISVLRGKGSGAFYFRVNTAIPKQPGLPAGPFNADGLAGADLNGDGKTDLVVTGDADTIDVLRATTGGHFTLFQQIPNTSIPSLTALHNLAIADLNGDAILDLAVTSGGTDEVGIFHGSGGGNFALASAWDVNVWPVAFDRGPFDIVAADFNKDGFIDLATANTNASTRSVLVNDGAGHFSQVIESPQLDESDDPPVPNPTYAPIAIAYGDFNKDGKQDIILANFVTNNVTVLLNTTVPIT